MNESMLENHQESDEEMNERVSQKQPESNSEQTLENIPVVQNICPVTAKERFIVLDILRGLAIFGILLVNVHDFAFPDGTRNMMYYTDYFPSFISEFVVLGSDFVARGKFIGMFSFLFGVGMAVLLERTIARGISFPRFYSKRLLVLLLIGLVHGCMIWDGDVLMTYAIFGFFLMAFYKAKSKTIIRWAVSFKVFYLAFIITGFIFAVNVQFKDVLSNPVKVEEKYNELMEQGKTRVNKQVELFQDSSFSELHERRIFTAFNRQWGSRFYGWNILAMFLFGLWAWKKRIFQDPEKNRTLLVKVCRTSFIIGLISNVYVVLCKKYAGVEMPELFFMSFMAEYIAAFFFCMFYVSGVTLIIHKPFFARLFHPFSYIGRAALTNYVLHSIVFTLIFYSYGLGLYGKVEPLTAFVLAVIVYTIQVYANKLWLTRFRFGPLEWIWRSMTYGKQQPMRIIPDFQSGVTGDK